MTDVQRGTNYCVYIYTDDGVLWIWVMRSTVSNEQTLAHLLAVPSAVQVLFLLT